MSLKYGHFQTLSLIFSFFLISAHQTSLYGTWQTPPEQFTTSGAGFSPDVAANSTGDAMAVWIDTSMVKASNFKVSNANWGPFTTISTNSGTNSSSRVAFDGSGRALAIWVASASPNTVHSAFFNGTSWSEVFGPPLDSSANPFQSPAIAMNGSGKGVAGWIEQTSNAVNSSFFSSSFWNLATNIGTGDGSLSIAYSANNSAVAVWTNAGVVTANQSISGVWQTATAIGEPGDVAPQVGIDSNGKAQAIWLLNPSGVVLASTFNGMTWSASQVISSGTGNIDPSLAVAPGGTAVATWIDSSFSVQSSIYNGTSWSSPTLVSNSPLAKQADVSIAANGNAFVLWTAINENEIGSASLTLGGTWGNQVALGIFTNPPDQVVSAFSSAGPAFGVWIEATSSTIQNAFGSFSLAVISPAPPKSIKGKVCVDAFAVQVDRLHIITFEPSKDKTVTFYRLKRNGMIIAEISSKGPFKYIDHNRSKHQRDVYALTSVNAGDLESTPLTVILK